MSLGCSTVRTAASCALLMRRSLSVTPRMAAAFAPEPGLPMTGGDGGELCLWDLRDLIARPRYLLAPNGPQIHWDLGTLQFAPSVNGPWLDLPAASAFPPSLKLRRTNPLSPIGEKGFFRVKVSRFAEATEDEEE